MTDWILIPYIQRGMGRSLLEFSFPYNRRTTPTISKCSSSPGMNSLIILYIAYIPPIVPNTVCTICHIFVNRVIVVANGRIATLPQIWVVSFFDSVGGGDGGGGSCGFSFPLSHNPIDAFFCSGLDVDGGVICRVFAVISDDGVLLIKFTTQFLQRVEKLFDSDL